MTLYLTKFNGKKSSWQYGGEDGVTLAGNRTREPQNRRPLQLEKQIPNLVGIGKLCRARNQKIGHMAMNVNGHNAAL